MTKANEFFLREVLSHSDAGTELGLVELGLAELELGLAELGLELAELGLELAEVGVRSTTADGLALVQAAVNSSGSPTSTVMGKPFMSTSGDR